MARSEINTEFNTFVGGILTEANPINYPVGYTLDEENFILERNGTRRRRKGLTLDTSSVDMGEKAHTVVGGLADTSSYRRSFLWENPSKNNTGLNFSIYSIYDVSDASDLTVDQDWSSVLVYDIETPTDVSGNFISSQVFGNILTSSCIFKSNLVLSARTYELAFGTFPISPSVHNSKYDGTSSLSLIDTYSLQVRNFAIAPDTSLFNDRKGTLSFNHFYNMVNQGWEESQISLLHTATSTFPALADNVTFSKTKGSSYSVSQMQNSLFGNKIAPLGKHITSAWGVSTASAATFVDQYTAYTAGDATYKGVTIGTPSDLYTPLDFANPSGAIVDMSVYGGRVFYLCDAISSPLLGSTFVAYGQSIGQETSIADCYQINDPTAEDLNQLLETDGGVLDLSQIGKALKIQSSRSRLLAYGTNGVYEILSRDDIFSPASAGIREVSNNTLCNFSEYSNNKSGSTGLGVRRPVCESIVVFKDMFYYWSDNGIQVLSYNKDSNEFIENNLTDSTIQSLYNSIPNNCKAAARGVFSKEDSAILWCYSIDTDNPKRFSKALIYDVVLNSWTKFNFYTDNSCYIRDVLEIPSSIPNNSSDDFLKQILFIVETPDHGITTAYFSDDSFEDFQGSTGSGERQAFMQTGYLNANNSSLEKQATYIVPSFLRTEDGFTDDGSGNLTPTNQSSCLISAWWDYVDDASLPKANDTFEAYKYNRLYIPSGPADTFDYGQTVLTTKNRLTGRGRALSLRFETSEGKDCRLLGWNLGFGANSKV